MTTKNATKRASAGSGSVGFDEVRPEKLIDLINQALAGLNAQGSRAALVVLNGRQRMVIDAAPAVEVPDVEPAG